VCVLAMFIIVTPPVFWSVNVLCMHNALCIACLCIVWMYLSYVSQDEGNTALHYASLGGHVEVFSLLIEHGAYVHAKNKVSAMIA
jgi:hypothetical protein